MERKQKILITDDTADIVELLNKRLTADGYETAPAYDGEECLAKVEQFRPDLIILDVMMPKLDGFDVCKRLRANDTHRHIPILMLTAKSEITDKVRGLDTGADAYITKPFNYKEIAACVRSLLARDEANRRLAEEEKTEALDQMVDEFSHELRNPLVAIGGFARRVSRALPEESRERKYMDIILENVVSLEKMVAHLIALKGATISFFELCDINQIIRSVLDQFAASFTSRAIVVETNIMDNHPLLPADRENLIKAIANIVENAVEAMNASQNKVLRIGTAISDGSIDIRIADTGRGISRDKIKSIYDPFFTSKIYGPGLGLTFALKAIQSHQGKISVESEEGVGTVFTIHLPMRGRPPA